MSHIEVNSSSLVTTNFFFSEKSKAPIQIALITIAIVGIVVAAFAIILYLPPLSGYCGGGFSLLSLIVLVIYRVKCHTRQVNPSQAQENPNNSPISPSVINKKENDNQKGTKALNLGTQTLGRLPIDTIPNDIILLVFELFKANELACVSRVSKKWYKLASSERLWITHCLNERIPLLNQSSTSSRKISYAKTKTLQNKLAALKKDEVVISNSKKETGAVRSALIIGGKILLYHFKQYLREDYTERLFEASDLKFCNPVILEEKDEYLRETNYAKFKIIGDKVFFTGLMEGIHRHRNYFALVFDLTQNKVLGRYLFFQNHDIIDMTNPNIHFELSEKNAFLGNENGIISLWDISVLSDYHKSYQKRGFGYWAYSDVPTWDEECESKLSALLTQDSEKAKFDIKSYKEMKENNEWLKTQKKLNGHSGKITCLLYQDEFLFSADDEGVIKQWDISKLECIKTIITGHTFPIKKIIVKGEYIFVSCRNKITQWMLLTQELLVEFNFQEEVKSFDIVGNLLFYCASTTTGKKIEVYNLFTKECLTTLLYSNDSNFYSDHNHFQVLDNKIVAFDKDKLVTWE